MGNRADRRRVPSSWPPCRPAGWRSLDLIESNEAFAAQALAVSPARLASLRSEITNVSGGAIALGHPIGASGCRVLVTLLHGMARLSRRRRARHALHRRRAGNRDGGRTGAALTRHRADRAALPASQRHRRSGRKEQHRRAHRRNAWPRARSIGVPASTRSCWPAARTRADPNRGRLPVRRGLARRRGRGGPGGDHHADPRGPGRQDPPRRRRNRARHRALRDCRCPHSHAAAAKAVELVRLGRAELLMKGSLHTDELMARGGQARYGPADRAADQPCLRHGCARLPEGVRHYRRRHQYLPRRSRTRCDIVQNAIDLLRALGHRHAQGGDPVRRGDDQPEIPSTIEAAALCKMADRGQITGGILDGPLAFDNAIDPEAAQIKRIESPVAGHPDILVVPDLEAGNMLAKNLTFLASADAAGLVLGRAGADHPHQPRRLVRTRHGLLRGRRPLRERAPRGPAPRRRAMADDPRRQCRLVQYQVPASSTRAARRPRLPLKGQIDGIGTRPRLRATRRRRAPLIDQTFAAECPDVATALDMRRAWLREQQRSSPDRVGHRVVHGGPDYAAPVAIDDDVLDELERLSRSPRCTSRNNLAPIRAILRACPGPPQVACFDTAFHRTIPRWRDRFAIPEPSIARACAAMASMACPTSTLPAPAASVAPEIASGRVVVAHLGSGASMCAMRAAGASTARWALRRWTACRWARDPASSIPASCST